MPFATKENTAEGFKAVGERVDEIEKDTTLAVQELTESLKAIQQRQRLLRGGALNRQDNNEKSSLVFSDLEMAKAFGESVIAAPLVKTRGRDKAMGEVSDGTLVDSEISTVLLNKKTEYGVFAKNAMRVPMGAATSQLPYITDDLLVYSPGEGGKIDESDMGGGQVNLVPRKLACLARYSAELEDDCITALGELVGQSIARSIAKAEDLAGFLGDGTSTYWAFQGICGALRAVNATIANIKSLVVGSGNAYSELVLADFRKLCGILPAAAEAGAKWYVNKWFFWNVMLPLLWAETTGKPTIGTPEFFQVGPIKYFLGYPVEYTRAMPKAEANSQICAILGDLQQGVIIGERKTLSIARSDQFHFDTDEIAIRGLERIAISAHGVGDTTDEGSICGLITAAS